jgi:hypothetical protein
LAGSIAGDGDLTGRDFLSIDQEPIGPRRRALRLDLEAEAAEHVDNPATPIDSIRLPPTATLSATAQPDLFGGAKFSSLAVRRW